MPEYETLSEENRPGQPGTARTALIETYSGNIVDIPSPDPEDITIEDIAHSLSLQCRFNGHCSKFYSVAEHSILVVDWLDRHDCSPETQLYGLLHDADEAYLNDFPRPLKDLLPGIRPLEAKTEHAIMLAFGLQDPDEEEKAIVKMADNVLLITEAKAMMATGGDWYGVGVSPDPDISIHFMHPIAAEAAFLGLFRALVFLCRESAVDGVFEPEGESAAFRASDPERMASLSDE